MARVNVHGDVGEVELLERIGDALAVPRCRVLACLEVAVGDEVGQRVGFNDQCNGCVGVLFENGNDGCDCMLVGELSQG